MELHTTDPMARYDIVDIDDLEKLVYEELTSDEVDAPLLIFGAPGIGKTAILREAISKLPDGNEWKLIVRTLSTETPDNFFLPRYINGENYQDKAEDVPKTWIPVYKETGNPEIDEMEDKKLGKGLLFIDELSRATPQVLNVCLSLVHERIFNSYRVGSGWKIICASNRTEDEIVGQTDISNALLSRFGIAYFEPSSKKWSEWATTQKHIPPIFLQWINMGAKENLSGGQYFYWDPNHLGKEIYKINKFCMPRTWDNAFRKVAKLAKDKDLQGFKLLTLNMHDVRKRLSLFIPSEAVEIFMSYLSTLKVIGDFQEAFDVAWKGKKMENTLSKKELSNVALPLTQIIIASHSDKFPTEAEFTNFCNWLVEMDSDAMASYSLDILFNVFSAGLNNDQKDIFYLGVHKYKEHIKESAKNIDKKKHDGRMKIYDVTCGEWCKKWGWKNLSEAPDWFDGFKKLQNKFQKRFAECQIEGKDGLD